MNMKKNLVKKNFYFAMIVIVLLFVIGFVIAAWDSSKASHGTLYADVIEAKDPSGNGDISIMPGTGNVGIGTTSPTRKLDVRGPVRIDYDASNYDVWIQGGSATSGAARNLALLGIKSTDELRLNFGGEYTGGVRIAGPKTIIDGRVGIGTTSPDYELDVEGGNPSIRLHAPAGVPSFRLTTPTQHWTWTIPVMGSHLVAYDATNAKSPFSIEPNTPSNTLYLDSTGKVGIGINPPSEKLDVVGNIVASGTICDGGGTNCIGGGGGMGTCELIIDTFRGPAGNKAAYRTGGATTDTWEPVPVPDYCIGRPCLLYGYYINNADEMENPRFQMVYQASNVISGGPGGGTVRWYRGIISTGEKTNGETESGVLELADSLRMWDDKGSEAVCLRWVGDSEGPLESQKDLYRANAISSSTTACDRTDTLNNNGVGGDERESTIWYWAYRDSSVSNGMRIYACRMFE